MWGMGCPFTFVVSLGIFWQIKILIYTSCPNLMGFFIAFFPSSTCFFFLEYRLFRLPDYPLVSLNMRQSMISHPPKGNESRYLIEVFDGSCQSRTGCDSYSIFFFFFFFLRATYFLVRLCIFKWHSTLWMRYCFFFFFSWPNHCVILMNFLPSRSGRVLPKVEA